jgi:hypothetical protein
MDRTQMHRRLKWVWVGCLFVGLIDYLWWPKWGIADSIPVIYALSVIALALSSWAAEEAAPEGKDAND